MPYWLVQTGGEGPGIGGGLHARAYPGQGPVNTMGVASCADFLGKVEAAGGRTGVPKMAIPGIGWLAYCADPEGNTLGVMQADAAAGAPGA